MNERPSLVRQVVIALVWAAGTGVVASSIQSVAVAAAHPEGLEALSRLAFPGFLFGAFVFASAQVLLAAVSGRRAFSVVAAVGVATALAGFHVRKMRLLGLPLMPWDLAHTRHVLALMPTFAFDGVSVLSLAGLVSLVALLVVLLRRPALGWSGFGRFAAIVLVVLAWLPVGPVLGHWRVQRRLRERHGLENLVGNLRETMVRAGLPLTFYWNLDGLSVERPPNYDEAHVRAALEGISPESAPTDGVHPDVILVLAESVIDPARLGISITPDPLPFLHASEKTFPAGLVVSPVFGGATANAEFEVLSGSPVAFLPEGSLAYTHYVAAPVPTFTSKLKSAGYATRALHPFHAWFWSREQVYPLLGIDRFEGLEVFEEAEKFGPWVSDDALADRLIARLPTASDPPTFLFAITMGTHGTYLYTLPERHFTLGPGLSELSQHEFGNYVEAESKLDAALARVSDALSRSTRPTVVVVFGDHPPILRPDYGAYREAGKFDDALPPAQREWFATVPVWTFWNAAAEPVVRARVGGKAPVGGLTGFGPWIERAAGLPLDRFDRFVEEANRAVPVLRRDLVRAADGRTFDSPANVGEPAVKALVEKWRLLAYDRLHGARYSDETR